MEYLTDSTFVIDLWRERDKSGSAKRFAEANAGTVVGLPWIVKGEFMRGARLAGHTRDVVSPFLDSFIVIWPTEHTLSCYADVYAELRSGNAVIGPNDLWIAATARELNLPLLTRNATEFSRVRDLVVVDYRLA